MAITKTVYTEYSEGTGTPQAVITGETGFIYKDTTSGLLYECISGSNWTSYIPENYEASTLNTIVFDKRYLHGTWSAPITGDITLDLTDAKERVVVHVLWSGSANPTIIADVPYRQVGSVVDDGVHLIIMEIIDGVPIIVLSTSILVTAGVSYALILAKMTELGGSLPSAAQQTIGEAYFDRLTTGAQGDLLSKLDMFYLFYDDTNDLALGAAIISNTVNWADPENYNLTYVDGDAVNDIKKIADSGIQSNDDDYFDTGFIPSIGVNKLTLNDGMFGYFMDVLNDVYASVEMGVSSIGNCWMRNGTERLYFNSATYITIVGEINALKNKMAVRTSSTEVQIYSNGISLGAHTLASVELSTNTFRVCYNGAAANQPIRNTVALAFSGQSFNAAEALEFYNAWVEYKAAIDAL